jgi:carboxymethylenebutenolidase
MADDLSPTRIHAQEIPDGAFRLYDAYCHGQISRRDFFDGLGKYAVGGMSVASLAACMMPDYTRQQTAAGEAELIEETLDYKSPEGAGNMQGYLVRPASRKDVYGGILVVHENRGLNPHIRDVTRRVAKAGYMAFAPDALFPLGGYPGTDDAGRELQAKRDRVQMYHDFAAGAGALRERCGGKVGVTGFCFGGAIANQLAVGLPWLAASVPFYGGWPKVEEAASVKAPLLIHLASDDPRINDAWPAYESALKAAGKAYTVHVYPGTQHGFHNDTTPRFNAEAAALAWSRTLEFFDRHVK